MTASRDIGGTPTVPDFEFEETTIAGLQDAMAEGRHSARSIAETFLKRISAIDKQGPAVNAVVELNPDALEIADALDAERSANGPRGPLHGIPVLLKDNIDTADRMATTAGSLALAGSIAPEDAFVAHRLREAGTVILGKTNLSEWANFRSKRSSSGWSARGGQTRNPYVLDRNPSGSSAGSAVAVAASMCAAAIGTETDGSIISPATVNGIVGIKPTVGLIGRSGIIPISCSQDTAGPLARTVADAAAVLGALIGVDPRDNATLDSTGKAYPDYTRFLDPRGLEGARIGVARHYFGRDERVDAVAEAALDAMTRVGATLVDPADIATVSDLRRWEYIVLLYEFKAGLNAYLSGLGVAAPVRSLKEVIAFNEANHNDAVPNFGQEHLLRAEEMGPLTSEEYTDAAQQCRRLARVEGIDATLAAHRLDAIVAPSGGPSWVTDLVIGDRDLGSCSSPAAVAGYPHVTVPAGFVHGLPVGVSFMGAAYSEPTLIKLAYAFEQATKHRRPPEFQPTVDPGRRGGP